MPEIERIRLTGGVTGLAVEGPCCALYVMVTADETAAKVGALYKAVNAEVRLRAVERDQRQRVGGESFFPMRLAVLAELDGLDAYGPDADEAWAWAEHYEGALRLILARRFGRFAPWTEWIYLDRTIGTTVWTKEIVSAWNEISGLGRTDNVS